MLVVDDSPEYLQAVSHLLVTFPCVGAINTARSSAEALAAVTTHPPDLLLVDLALPAVNGLALTRTLKARPQPPRIIVVSLYDSPAYRAAAQAAGADAFLGKSDLGTDLHAVIAALFPDVCR
jgi:DNA-binding NarL/FixJ family response regulator